MLKEVPIEGLTPSLLQSVDLVDVREADEVAAEGVIPGSQNWPLSSFAAHLKKLSRSRPTLFYCRTGMRSMKAAEIAESWTECDVYTLVGGYIAYETSRASAASSGFSSEKGL